MAVTKCESAQVTTSNLPNNINKYSYS